MEKGKLPTLWCCLLLNCLVWEKSRGERNSTCTMEVNFWLNLYQGLYQQNTHSAGMCCCKIAIAKLQSTLQQHKTQAHQWKGQSLPGHARGPVEVCRTRYVLHRGEGRLGRTQWGLNKCTTSTTSAQA